MTLGRIRFFIAGVGASALGIVALVGCAPTSGAGADVSVAGQVSYACALSEEAGVPSEGSSAIGDDAAPEAVAAAGAVALLGGVYGYSIEDHPELSTSAASYVRGLATQNIAVLDESLEDVRAGCSDAGIEPTGDVSPEGQRAYACALADGILSEHGAVDSWGELLDDPAWYQSSAVAALGGALTGTVLTGAEDLSENAAQIQRGTQTRDLELVQTGLDGVVASCR